MLVLWFINLLGIWIFFLVRFENRKKKNVFNPIFWIKDNWIELLAIFLFDIALMIIIMHPDISVNPQRLIEKYIPFDVVATGFAAKMIVSFLIGLGLSSGLYSLVKRLKIFNAPK